MSLKKDPNWAALVITPWERGVIYLEEEVIQFVLVTTSGTLAWPPTLWREWCVTSRCGHYTSSQIPTFGLERRVVYGIGFTRAILSVAKEL